MNQAVNFRPLKQGYFQVCVGAMSASLLGLILLATPAIAEVSPETIVDIFKRLDQIEKKSRELQGENEVLKHELDNLKKIQKEGFLSFDERFDALIEKNQSTNAADKSDTKESSSKTEKDEEKTSNPDATSVTKTNEDKVVSTESSTLKKVEESEKAADKEELDSSKKAAVREATKYEKETYQAAFDTMKKSPTAATKAFEEYIQMQPDSPLAANAQYWIGEIKYSHNNYKGAVEDFIKVLQNYKFSDKAPDAAIKLGYSFFALKNWAFARRTFEDVLKYFPDNDNAVRLAKDRLAKLDAAGN